MAIFRSTIFNEVRKKLANTVMYRLYSKGIMRSYTENIRNPQTPEQMLQRAKIRLLGDLSRRLTPIIKVGMRPLAKKQTVHNAFVQANIRQVTVDEDFNATLAAEAMLCSDGVLTQPEVGATLDTANGEVKLTHGAEEVMGLCSKDDRVYAGLFESERREALLVELGERGETANVTKILPARWNPEKVCVYVFAVSKSKRNASPSYAVELS